MLQKTSLQCQSNLAFPMGLERLYFFGTHEPSFARYYKSFTMLFFDIFIWFLLESG